MAYIAMALHGVRLCIKMLPELRARCHFILLPCRLLAVHMAEAITLAIAMYI